MKRHELISFRNDPNNVADVNQLFLMLKSFERKVYLSRNKELISKFEEVNYMASQTLEDKDLIILVIEMWLPLLEELEKEKNGFTKAVLNKIIKNDLEDFSVKYISQIVKPFQIKMKYEEETFNNISTMYEVWENNKKILNKEFDNLINEIENKKKGKTLRLS